MNFVELLEENQIPYREYGFHPHTTRGRVNIDCPFCSPGSEKFRLGYHLTYGYCNCWNCGRLPLQKLIAVLLGDWRQAKEIVSQLERTDRLPKSERPKGKLVVPNGLGPLAKCHKHYLRKRGFDPKQLVKLWSIQGFTLHHMYSWRIFLPVHLNGQMVSWTTRSLSNAGCRYKSAPADHEAVPAKSLLYGEDYARHAICVVEGPTDVWGIGPGAVATFGLAYTRSQVKRMTKYPVRGVCFDNTPDAQKVAKELCAELEPFPGKTLNIQLDSKDPGEASKKEIQLLRKTLFGE